MQDRDTPSRNIYAAAYMRPVYDNGGGSNLRDNVAFAANVPFTTNDITTQIELGRDSSGNEGDDFWVVYVQLAYQGGEADDADPIGSSVLGGVTPAGVFEATGNSVPDGGNGCLVFIEAGVDYDLSIGGTADYTIRGVPHEVGHQFGLKGDNSFNDYGIMNPSGSRVFVPSHLNTLRWRVKSPGRIL